MYAFSWIGYYRYIRLVERAWSWIIRPLCCCSAKVRSVTSVATHKVAFAMGGREGVEAVIDGGVMYHILHMWLCMLIDWFYSWLEMDSDSVLRAVQHWQTVKQTKRPQMDPWWWQSLLFLFLTNLLITGPRVVCVFFLSVTQPRLAVNDGLYLKPKCENVLLSFKGKVLNLY